MPRQAVGGVVLAALWFVTSGMSLGLQSAGGSLATLGRLVPSPTGYGLGGLPLPWAVSVQILIAAVLVTGYAAFVTLFASGPRVPVASGWLAAILTVFLVGAVLDLGSFVVWLGPFGVRGAIGTMGATPLAVWWAVLAGWLPAVVTAARRRPHPSSSSNVEPSSGGRRLTPSFIGMAIVALVAAVALPVVAQAGHAAGQQHLVEDQAAAQPTADPDGAAAADPSAVGEPVPPVAATSDPVTEGQCTSENTTILAPAPDAATGHRGQVLHLVNTSDAPCTVNGYPDVAYGDQNSHLLEVAVERGSSFMGQDPGARPVTLAPGDAASAIVGWDANSVHGQLAARSLWVAAHAGAQRLTWEVSLDIIPGASVHVTAWHARDAPGG